ncbi:hypothetical protein EDB81DRAFT_757073 [Dactylonectria macrodidyma]|uniref:Uncharacterized protein n=1 Tax=Dactylonectria macrodidyma TaxID=307937 RepID=A0A9P9JDK1_9HYPO|nr:hypothetical protein EDB81DRAFT_757073 [Dactylonectria macrodidyma]
MALLPCVLAVAGQKGHNKKEVAVDHGDIKPDNIMANSSIVALLSTVAFLEPFNSQELLVFRVSSGENVVHRQPRKTKSLRRILCFSEFAADTEFDQYRDGSDVEMSAKI